MVVLWTFGTDHFYVIFELDEILMQLIDSIVLIGLKVSEAREELINSPHGIPNALVCVVHNLVDH